MIETGSPEITVFDTAHVKLQRYFTRGGDGMVIVRVEDPDGSPVISLSLFGIPAAGGCREVPEIELTGYDERIPVNRAQTYPLPAIGDGRVRYLIIGESEEAVRSEAGEFQRSWGLAYNPITGSPRRRGDGKWAVEATRWCSSD